jgi:TolB protein
MKKLLVLLFSLLISFNSYGEELDSLFGISLYDNAEPVFSPDGKQLALIHRVGKDDRLALFDIASRNLTVLTLNKLDESPYFSPNGGMIIFATRRNNKGALSVISLHNNQIVELAQKGVEVRDPNWSNYSK